MKHLFILALALIVGACVTSSNDVAKPKTETGFLGLSEKDAMNVTTAKAFAGKTNVVVNNFKVAFITESEGRNSTGSGGLLGGGMKGHASADVTLTGVSDAAMQAITDQAYADFTATMAAKGYTVQPASSIAGMPEMQKVSAENVPYTSSNLQPSLNSEGKIFAPTGQKLYLLAGQGVRMGGFGFANPGMAYATIAEKTGTPIIDVYYVLDIAGYGGHSSMSSASLSVGQSMHVKTGSAVSIIGGQSGTFSTTQGNIALGQPIASDKAFGTVTEETSGGMKAAGYAANTVSALLGGATSIARDFSIASSDEAYKAAALDALTKANKAMVGQMAALR